MQLGFEGMLSPFYQKRYLRTCTQGLLSHTIATVVQSGGFLVSLRLFSFRSSRILLPEL